MCINIIQGVKSDYNKNKTEVFRSGWRNAQPQHQACLVAKHQPTCIKIILEDRSILQEEMAKIFDLKLKKWGCSRLWLMGESPAKSERTWIVT